MPIEWSTTAKIFDYSNRQLLFTISRQGRATNYPDAFAETRKITTPILAIVSPCIPIVQYTLIGHVFLNEGSLVVEAQYRARYPGLELDILELARTLHAQEESSSSGSSTIRQQSQSSPSTSRT